MRKVFVLAGICVLVSFSFIGCAPGNPKPGDVLTPGGYRLFATDTDNTAVSSGSQQNTTTSNNSTTAVNSTGNQNNTTDNNGWNSNCAPKKQQE